MSNFTQLVFTNSLLLTLVVGSKAGLLVRGTRRQDWLLPFVIVAALVHLSWWAWPILSSEARAVARWAFAVWVGVVLTATALLPLFAIAQIIAHPKFFPVAASQGVQLTLSSHTHGGQVAIFGRPLFAAYDYIAGRYEAGGKHLDVSAGWALVAVEDGRSASGRDRHSSENKAP